MTKQVIKTEQAPPPIGPYNQAIKANGFVFTSGQIPLDPKTGELVAEDVAGQTQAVLGFLEAILKEAGSSLDQIVKTTVFLKDMNTFGEMNAVYTKFFEGKIPPSRSTIEVARLPKDVKVEIEVIALTS